MLPRDDSETDKRVIGTLLAGKRFVHFDNIRHTLGGGALEALLTSRSDAGRVLGKTGQVEAPNLAAWTFTANGATTTQDLVRRVLLVRLDPRTEIAAERSSFHYPDLVAHLLANQPRLQAAATTVLQAFIAAGKPRVPDLAAKGSFVGWDALVRQAVLRKSFAKAQTVRRMVAGF